MFQSMRSICWSICYTKSCYQTESLRHKFTSVVSHTHTRLSRCSRTFLQRLKDFNHPPTLHRAASESVASMTLDVVTAAAEDMGILMVKDVAEAMVEEVSEIE